MTDATDNTIDAQKPSEVVATVAATAGKVGKRAADPVLDVAASGAVQLATPELAAIAGLRHLLAEAATILTIYAEVAVPVASYRGQPLSAHAPRELVERIHRAIGA